MSHVVMSFLKNEFFVPKMNMAKFSRISECETFELMHYLAGSRKCHQMLY